MMRPRPLLYKVTHFVNATDIIIVGLNEKFNVCQWNRQTEVNGAYTLPVDAWGGRDIEKGGFL